MAATSRGAGSETRLLRELIIEHLSRWIWRTRSELQRRVEQDFGPVQDRRFMRQMAFLRGAGAVSMIIDESMDPPMPVYRALPKARREMAAKIPHLFCQKCGLINAQTRGHRNGHRRFIVEQLPMRYIDFDPALREPRPEPIRNPVARLRIEARRTSAGSPGSPPPAATSIPPGHPLAAARHAR